jgi:hypothetical protein
VLSVWVGWYGTALGLGILGAWFGVELWKIARLDTKVLLLLVAEVILIWLAFSLAYLEMTSDLSDALSLSMQHLLHFDFINISNDLSDSLLFRALAAFEGLVGYLLIVSGVVLLIQKETKTS